MKQQLLVNLLNAAFHSVHVRVQACVHHTELTDPEKDFKEKDARDTQFLAGDTAASVYSWGSRKATENKLVLKRAVQSFVLL